jgi:hypothetical protein
MWMKEDEKRKKEKGVSERVILRMKNEQDWEEQESKEPWSWLRGWRWRLKERKKGKQNSKRELGDKVTARSECYAYSCSSYASLMTFVRFHYISDFKFSIVYTC